MASPRAYNRLDRVFAVTLALKALDGLLETIGGLSLFIISPSRMNHWAVSITQHELSQDPHDFFATHFLHSVQHFATGGRIFAAVYLLSHGLTKIILVAEIWRGKLWAYKAMVVFLALFIVYQLYLMLYKPSLSLALLTLFDGFIIYLTVREYKRRRYLLHPTASAPRTAG
jgi:uncharacterized membrane protein